MKTLLQLSVVLLAVSAVTPCQAENGISIMPDIVYGHKDGMALTYDVIKPTDGANGAAVMFMVSGGWFSRWARPESTAKIFAFLTDEGYVVMAVRHGSAPRYKVPDAVKDVKRAVRHVRLHADEYGVDPDRLGVIGGSAGGHLSLMIGATAEEGNEDAKDEVLHAGNSVAAVVAYFPPVDLRDLVGPSERFPALDFATDLAESVSPLLHVTSDDPPTLLIHGDADELVPLSNSKDIYAAMQEAHITSKLIVIEGAGHGFSGEANDRAREAAVAWFDKHLAKK